MTLQRINKAALADRPRTAILTAPLYEEFDGRRLLRGDVPAAMFSESCTTIGTALRGLVHEGVVARCRTIGTIVDAHLRPYALGRQRLVEDAVVHFELVRRR